MINACHFLFWNCFKPFYGVASTFPQIDYGRLDNFFILSKMLLLSDSDNFRLAWVNESSTGWVINEIWFVIFQCYE